MQRNEGVGREKEKCGIHELKNTIEICRFADLLENLKSESGNYELMKSRIVFIKKE